MFAKFDNIFNNSDNHIIPDEIVSAINSIQDLPKGYKYVKHDSFCMLESIEPENNKEVTYKGNIIVDKEVLDKCGDDSVTSKNILEYLYRTQSSAEVTDLKLIVNGKEYDMEVGQFDTSSKPIGRKMIIIPRPFLEPQIIPIQIIDGKKFDISFSRKPYNSMDTMLFSNDDFKSLDIKLYFHENTIDNDNFDVDLSITININETKSVDNLIDSLELYKAFMNSNIIIDGTQLPKVSDAKYDKNWINAGLEIWHKVKELETMLKLNFNPSKDLNENQYTELLDLYDTLIENKELTYYNCVQSFNASVNNIADIEKHLNKTGMSVDFIGSKNISVLEQEFIVYSYTKISDYIITSIEHIENQLYKFNLKSENNKKIKLQIMYFLTEEEAISYSKQN